MKSLLRYLTLASVLLVASARGTDDKLIAAVRAADDARVAATIAADRAKLDAIYSADLYYAHSSGKIDNKAAHLAGMENRDSAYEKFDYQTRDFLPAGLGLVLMTGHVIIHSGSAKGKTQNDVNFLAVWREEKGQWRFLAWQACKNPSADAAKK